MEPINIISQALEELAINLIVILPKLILALIIWYLGRYLINLAVKLISKLDLKTTKIDDHAVATFSKLIIVVGRVLLVLIILDYLGIARTVVGAITNGLVYAVAIALGLAFGKALEDDAKEVVKTIKSFFSHHS